MRKKIISTLLLTTGLAAPALPAETITYSYDARGRLIQVARTSTVNYGATTTHQFDKADNRTSKTTVSTPPP